MKGRDLSTGETAKLAALPEFRLTIFTTLLRQSTEVVYNTLNSTMAASAEE